MAFALVCDVEIEIGSQGEPICSTGWVQQVHVAPFSISDIDPSVATAMFAGGFLLFLVPWASAWGFTQLLKMIR